MEVRQGDKIVRRSREETIEKTKSYRRHKRIKMPVFFSLIRLLILYLHILHLLYLHISYSQNCLYLAVSTHSFYYTIALNSESKTRYIHHLGLGIELLYYLLLRPICPLLSIACLVQAQTFNKKEITLAKKLAIRYIFLISVYI